MVVPSKLKRHLITKRSHFQITDADYFKRLLDTRKKDVARFVGKVRVSEKAQEASYVAAQMIMMNMKPYIIGERLLKLRFAIQVDETRQGNGRCSLIGFFRYISGSEIVTQFMFLKEIQLQNTGLRYF